MAKFDHAKRNMQDKMRKQGVEISDPASIDTRSKRRSRKTYSKTKSKPRPFIDLGEHEHHDYTIERGPFGNHAGKLMCCGRFVRWLPRSVFR